MYNVYDRGRECRNVRLLRKMPTTADRCHNTSTVNARRSRIARIHAQDVEHIFEIQTMCLHGNLQHYKYMSVGTLLYDVVFGFGWSITETQQCNKVFIDEYNFGTNFINVII